MRISSVDNFQGEEAKIIVISLVRSNGDCRIGFLKEPERVNVLLSRARDGLILIGNDHCLVNSTDRVGKRIWTQALDVIARVGVIAPGLPIKCEQHGNVVLARSEPDFKRASPLGGCRLPCSFPLNCGHACPHFCHSSALKHDDVICKADVQHNCEAGHVYLLKCSHQGPQECPHCLEERAWQVELERQKNACMLRMAQEKAEFNKRAQKIEAELAAAKAELKLQAQSTEIEVHITNTRCRLYPQ
jgi:hypothetical protein